MTDVDRMGELRDLYEKHCNTPFPPSHDAEVIQKIHDYLVLYDAWIAGYITRILKGELTAIKKLKEDQRLRRKIDRLLQEGHEASGLLRQYEERYERLEQMINVARSLK